MRAGGATVRNGQKRSGTDASLEVAVGHAVVAHRVVIVPEAPDNGGGRGGGHVSLVLVMDAGAYDPAARLVAGNGAPQVGQ